jgi:hypothetical protein
MTYDLVIGKSNKLKDKPLIVGGIEFSEYETICSLAKRIDSFFINRISNLFDDQSFAVDELENAISQLYPLLQSDLKDKELILLHKLIAIVSYAIYSNQPLHGVAD